MTGPFASLDGGPSRANLRLRDGLGKGDPEATVSMHVTSAPI